MKILKLKLANQKSKFVRWKIRKMYKGDLPFKIVGSRTIISFKENYFYNRIPKAANSTVIASLYAKESGVKLKSLDEVQIIKNNYFTYINDLDFQQLKQLQNLYKFTLVRNPVSRITSAYLDKVKNKNAPQRKLILRALNKNENDDITFDEFLFYLENGGIYHNAHWSLQKDLLFFDINKYDFIGKMENISSDLPIILENIYDEPSRIISIMPHARKKNILENPNSFQLKKIHSIYQPDFHVFKYKPS
ncbi:sulfotransferase family protein [Winogradskyella bathintestinalis]|uniref:Sulfotransferase family protein n=1 Tax=Winogradskyella bathintestinalis TaxID=3035208 RepID=A0ABT7ZTU0_9FLAO|nr:sulfotransferase family protein [Winogradskyella bathintestinalis]MDN3492422.1 sulfotransferase family protein [Winogradskyella bathintestinalis]